MEITIYHISSLENFSFNHKIELKMCFIKILKLLLIRGILIIIPIEF
jgi:hypothetical protein